MASLRDALRVSTSALRVGAGAIRGALPNADALQSLRAVLPAANDLLDAKRLQSLRSVLPSSDVLLDVKRLVDTLALPWQLYDKRAASPSHHAALDVLISRLRFRNVLHPHAFYPDGFGNVPVLLGMVTEVKAIQAAPTRGFPRIEPVLRRSSHGRAFCSVLEGSFPAPLYAEHMPPESGAAAFQLVTPRCWKEGARAPSGAGASAAGAAARLADSAGTVAVEMAATRPCVILLPGTGEQGFRRRRHLVAYPLAQMGVASVILEGPFYGSRKPPSQRGSKLADLTSLPILGRATLEEARALVQWLRERSDEEAIDPQPTAEDGRGVGVTVVAPTLSGGFPGPAPHARAGLDAECPVEEATAAQALAGSSNALSAAPIRPAAGPAGTAAGRAVAAVEDGEGGPEDEREEWGEGGQETSGGPAYPTPHSQSGRRALPDSASASATPGGASASGPAGNVSDSGALAIAEAASLSAASHGGAWITRAAATLRAPPAVGLPSLHATVRAGLPWGASGSGSLPATSAAHPSSSLPPSRGYGAVVLGGTSMGGLHAAMTATLLPREWRDVGVVSWLGPPSAGAVFTQGRLALGVAWDALAAHATDAARGRALDDALCRLESLLPEGPHTLLPAAPARAAVAAAFPSVAVPSLHLAMDQAARLLSVTDITNFGPSQVPALFVRAAHDQYVLHSEPATEALWGWVREAWPQSELRNLRGGHVSGSIFALEEYVGAVVEVIRRVRDSA